MEFMFKVSTEACHTLVPNIEVNLHLFVLCPRESPTGASIVCHPCVMGLFAFCSYIVPPYFLVKHQYCPEQDRDEHCEPPVPLMGLSYHLCEYR